MAQELAALHVALGLAAQPNLVDQARNSGIPPGIALLLEIAADDKATLERCVELTSIPEGEIRAASEFYIEQVLLHEHSDSYRALGADTSASSADLRRHMALLMRWLHPDAAPHAAHGALLDRTVLAERVARAWDNVKSEDRRAAYDVRAGAIAEPTIPSGAAHATRRASQRRRKPRLWGKKKKKPMGRRTPLALYRQQKSPARLRIVRKRGDNWIVKVVLNLFRRKS